ncbi:hypothetical protein FIV42_27200 [Persicimonas caeni]|uniref:Uncharacterized protein n=1 Tax=Persicimonas caeni TaxID=2292766 RepID=A0A4Y6Q1G9_PERCE|nr:hypothetical protein [Persicimonas caeni]QDG54299.1 hypothetical protein FIV42_27200 [Persicimonas caeni]QED35520.1 hypothetical protein FRD00_27195 [Persicimonas caeni]
MSCRNQAPARAAGDGTQKAVSQKTNDKQQDRESGADEAKSYYYSPFVVKLAGGKFDTVSFKDVGLDRESTDANDPLLETISHSFARKVAAHKVLGYQAEVMYDEEILDPSNHLYCGLNHLYVDIWQSSSPKRWGYSLWSGCGELDNFAWKEVPDTVADEDLTLYVEPLTSHIVDSLAEAARSNCFQKSC